MSRNLGCGGIWGAWKQKRRLIPSGVRLRLEGMGVELGEVFPGGFGSDADGSPPQRFGGTDLFSLDPDRDVETYDATGDAAGVVRLADVAVRRARPRISRMTRLRVEDAARPAASRA